MKFETYITAVQTSEASDEQGERLMDQYDTSDLPEDPTMVEGADGELAQFLELTRQSTKQQLQQIFEGEPEFFELKVEVVEEDE